ncbi:hypothetical protein Adt_04133 [Abeliophyllum distichum]|uniref:Reverse transcriptase domain-containing protein n=1 Tax=Abeliophyllum distichum TaxID=126358 RepID=A0ABD1W3V0_9LAMI
MDNAWMKLALERLGNQSPQSGPKRNRKWRRPSRLGIGSFIAPFQIMHNWRSENSEAHSKGRGDPRFVNAWFKDVIPKLECDLDNDDENLPFSKELKAKKLSVEFKMPSMEKYNGRGDPMDHINVFKTRFQGNIPACEMP